MFRVATAHALGARTPTAYANNVEVMLSPAPLNFAIGQLLRELEMFPVTPSGENRMDLIVSLSQTGQMIRWQ